MAATRARTTTRTKPAADVLAAIADLSDHINSNFATKGYVDGELARVAGGVTTEVGKLRNEMANRDDLRRIETSINQLQVTMAGTVAAKADVMARTESELRFKQLETTTASLTTAVGAINLQNDNRLWDVIKTVIPWVLLGLGFAVASSGHLTLH